ncbi:hypothetical protein BC835DRAFT_752466 [Cytidiella melzeri]|nr:hypothetical protein BC835DRAFT_752466 [Cytidiella melzeri]
MQGWSQPPTPAIALPPRPFPHHRRIRRVSRLSAHRLPLPHARAHSRPRDVRVEDAALLNVKRKTFSLGQTKISDILHSVLIPVQKHHVKIGADSVGAIGRQLDPGLNLLQECIANLRQLG